MKDIPVYRYPWGHAYQCGEEEQYRQSREASISCRKAIEQAIRENYNGYSLDTKAIVKSIIAEYGLDRVAFVLANTVRMKIWDGRISFANKAWAKTVTVFRDESDVGDLGNDDYVVNAHPGLTNMLVDDIRKLCDLKKKAAN